MRAKTEEATLIPKRPKTVVPCTKPAKAMMRKTMPKTWKYIFSVCGDERAAIAARIPLARKTRESPVPRIKVFRKSPPTVTAGMKPKMPRMIKTTAYVHAQEVRFMVIFSDYPDNC